MTSSGSTDHDKFYETDPVGEAGRAAGADACGGAYAWWGVGGAVTPPASQATQRKAIGR